jgi:hypothetical protein
MRILNWLTLLWKTRDWLMNLQCNISILKLQFVVVFVADNKFYIVTWDILIVWFYFNDIQASKLLQARGKRDAINRDITFAQSCMFNLPEFLSALFFYKKNLTCYSDTFPLCSSFTFLSRNTQ